MVTPPEHCPFVITSYSQVSLVVKNPPASAGDLGSIPGSGRSPGGGNGSPLQYSCLENLTDRGVRWAVHKVTKSPTQLKQFITRMCYHIDSAPFERCREYKPWWTPFPTFHTPVSWSPEVTVSIWVETLSVPRSPVFNPLGSARL